MVTGGGTAVVQWLPVVVQCGTVGDVNDHSGGTVGDVNDHSDGTVVYTVSLTYTVVSTVSLTPYSGTRRVYTG